MLEVKSVTGMGELSLETLVLERVGEGDVWLAGWQVTDEDGNLYQFPELLLRGEPSACTAGLDGIHCLIYIGG